MRRLVVSFILLIAPLFAASNSIPTVNQPLVPSAVAPGAGAFVLRVNGSAFVAGAIVKWNGNPLSTRFINRSELKALVPAVRAAKATTAVITVTNPAPGGGRSNPVFFTVTPATASLTFAPSSSFMVGTAISDVSVGDFNNDGRMDLAVLNEGAEYTCTDGTQASEYVSMFLGNGDGTFVPGETLELGCGSSFLDGSDFAMVAADFNGDGRIDLAISFTGDMCCVEPGRWVLAYLGNGDGTFNVEPYVVGNVSNGMGIPVAADFNGDGNRDLAIEGGDFGYILYVFEGQGDGTFPGGPETDLSPAFDGAASSWLAAGDFNRDGLLDMVSPPVNNLPSILLGNGDGTFSAASSQPPFAASANAPAVGDFTGDGILDLAVTDASANLNILVGNGDGTFIPRNGEPNAGPYGTPLTSDLNGDGKLDLAVSSATGNLVYLGNGDGTFQNALAIGPNGSTVGIADFNGDGRLDLVTLNANTITVLVQAPTAVPSSVDVRFGKQAVGTSSPARRITLANSGSAALHLSSIISNGDFAETNDCRAIVPLGQSCHIDVVFKPTAKGFRSGTITITDNAANSPQLIQLSGMGD
ncbi:MAG TPA: FG-GAP-like repeat-containing protein [Candidatus Sulfotelmatobacter sp.]